MQGVFILGIYVVLFVAGLVEPFVMGLGYVWVDLFSPQDVYPDVMGSFPVALIMGSGAIVSYLLTDRRYPPRFSWILFLLIVFGLWMTLTCFWAEVPAMAWAKWNWAVKAVLFAVVLPFLFRSRIQIEAFVLTTIFAACGVIVPVGIKTIITGGGYDMPLSLIAENSGVSEGATLAMHAAVMIPLIIFAAGHSVILPWARIRVIGCVGLTICCVAAALGSFQRTGLVALAALGSLLFLLAKRKILVGILLLVACAVTIPLTSQSWKDRMLTIGTSPSDASALARLAVWSWTFAYVKEHPLGGGFELYRIDKISYAGNDGSTIVSQGIAFHSIYFELLGETGVVGLTLWAILIFQFYRRMWVVYHKVRSNSDLAWLGQLIKMLCVSTTVYLVGGAFIGVGFRPLLYYLIGLGVCLGEYHRRWESEPPAYPDALKAPLFESGSPALIQPR